MGLDRFKHTPCGFCFVIYNNPEDAVNAVKYLSKTKLDERVIKIDLDSGFTNGRQFGRGASGGQVRDEIRYDMADSGYRYGGYQATEFDDNNGNNDDFNNETNYRFGARRVADVYVPENKEVAAEAEVEAPVKEDAEGDEEMKDTTEN